MIRGIVWFRGHSLSKPVGFLSLVLNVFLMWTFHDTDLSSILGLHIRYHVGFLSLKPKKPTLAFTPCDFSYFFDMLKLSRLNLSLMNDNWLADSVIRWNPYNNFDVYVPDDIGGSVSI